MIGSRLATQILGLWVLAVASCDTSSDGANGDQGAGGQATGGVAGRGGSDLGGYAGTLGPSAGGTSSAGSSGSS